MQQLLTAQRGHNILQELIEVARNDILKKIFFFIEHFIILDNFNFYQQFLKVVTCIFLQFFSIISVLGIVWNPSDVSDQAISAETLEFESNFDVNTR